MKKRMSLSNLSGFTNLCKSELFTVGAKGTTCKGTIQKEDKSNKKHIDTIKIQLNIVCNENVKEKSAENGYRGFEATCYSFD